MRPDISEFSYGYALTEELIHSPGVSIQSAPLFPSLIEEGSPTGGYDVQIPFVGFPLFLQFKLSDFMVRHTASEAKFGVLTPPFFRMHLRPRTHSRQHALLLGLEARGHLVFYAAPHFHLPSELNDAYINRRVIDRSLFVKPSAIGPLPDDRPHHVSFHAGQGVWFCSDPRPLAQEFDSRKIFDSELQEGFAKRVHFDGSRESTVRLASDLVSLVKESSAEAGTQDRDRLDDIGRREPRLQIAYLARAFFGCEIILIRPRGIGSA